MTWVEHLTRRHLTTITFTLCLGVVGGLSPQPASAATGLFFKRAYVTDECRWVLSDGPRWPRESIQKVSVTFVATGRLDRHHLQDPRGYRILSSFYYPGERTRTRLDSNTVRWRMRFYMSVWSDEVIKLREFQVYDADTRVLRRVTLTEPLPLSKETCYIP
jgi:hypothetical protein